MRGDVLGGDFAAAEAGAAAFEEIVGEELDVGTDFFTFDGGLGGFDGRRYRLRQYAGGEGEKRCGEGGRRGGGWARSYS